VESSEHDELQHVAFLSQESRGMHNNSAQNAKKGTSIEKAQASEQASKRQETKAITKVKWCERASKVFSLTR
jgi:hypothetical protein